MGTCNATKKNLAIKNEIVSVKCIIELLNGTTYSQYFKSFVTFREIKHEICKKIKVKKNSILLEIKGKLTKFEDISLSYIIVDKFDEIHIKVVENKEIDEKENIKDKEKSVKDEILGKEKNENFNSNNGFNSSVKFNSGLENNYVLDDQAICILSKNCEIHEVKSKEDSTIQKENIKMTLICQTCGQGICDLCSREYHKDHIIIKKISIVEFNSYISENKLTLDEQLKVMNITHDRAEVLKTFNNSFKSNTNTINKLMSDIIEKETTILTTFRNKIDMYLPYLLSYKQNLDNLSEEYKNNVNNLISNDKAFMKYYLDYILINNQITKSADSIESLKQYINFFNNIYEDYQKRTKSILDVICENYEAIMDYKLDFDLIENYQSNNNKYFSNDKEESKIEVSNKKNQEMNDDINLTRKPVSRFSLKNVLDLRSKNLSFKNAKDESFNDSIKINLKYLNNAPNKTISSMMKRINRNKSDNKSRQNKKNNLNIIDEKVIDKDISVQSITTMEVDTKNIFIFNINDMSITKQECNFTNSRISKFESFLSSLNYNDCFYISGSNFGIKNSGYFYYLDTKNGYSLSELPQMLSEHSFHSMCGLYNTVWVLSGSNSKSVEKYDITNKCWAKMPNLNYSKLLASSCFIDNLGLFVFGGQDNSDEDYNDETIQNSSLLKIEKLDIKHIKNLIYDSKSSDIEFIKWEILSIKTNNLDFPIYSGFSICSNSSDQEGANSNSVMIYGGKINNENYESEIKIINLNLDNMELKQEEISLKVPDEFDGKMLLKMKKTDVNEESQEIYYAQFSSIYQKRVHIIKENETKVLTYNGLDDSSFIKN